MARITVDPVTRIEGQWRTMPRSPAAGCRKRGPQGRCSCGIERILQGRDPLTHGSSPSASAASARLFTRWLPSVRSSTRSGWRCRSTQHIRNLILAAHAIHDHIVHFTTSALDWVDVVSALQADPAKASQPLPACPHGRTTAGSS